MNILKLFYTASFYGLFSYVSVAGYQHKLETISATLEKHSYEPQNLLVMRHPHLDANAVARLHDDLGAQLIHTYQHLPGLELVRIPEDISLMEAIEFYLSEPQIMYAEPDYRAYALQTPNDPSLSNAWGLNNTGQSGGVADVDINAPEMWDVSVGSPNVVLGIIDTGVEYTHPDLQANMWTNTLEIPGNGVDDDRNGYIDDIYGINAMNNNGNPLDDNGHGTHVAGIMAARGNNGIGISGVMQQASLIGCKFLGASGGGIISDALKCMDYFLALGKRSQSPVKVLATNNSWGGGGFTQAFLTALNLHNQAGILFAAAAGNSALNNDVNESYPSNYASANVIAVAAIDRYGALANFSNYGPNSVHVAAPGVDIYSTFLQGGYTSLSGTSMATPFVTGLLGLTKAFNPQLSSTQVKNLVVSSGVPAQGNAAKTMSGRRIRGWDNNGRGTTTCVDQIIQARTNPIGLTLMVPVGTAIPLNMFQLNCANPFGPSQVTVVDTNAVIDLKDDGVSPDKAANDAVFSGTFTPASRGMYDLIFPVNNFVYVGAYLTSNWNSYQATVLSAFEYVTIDGTGLGMGDDTVKAVTSPFPIKFANDQNGFTTVFVSSNGLMSFSNNLISAYQNNSLPDPSKQTLVSPYWDDFVGKPSTGSDVFYATVGTSPNRMFVVEWRNMPNYSNIGSATFQAVFYENSSKIQFNYSDVTFGNINFDKGASATVGVQVAGDSATLFSFNRPLLTDKMSVRFTTNKYSSIR